MRYLAPAVVMVLLSCCIRSLTNQSDGDSAMSEKVIEYSGSSESGIMTSPAFVRYNEIEKETVSEKNIAIMQ